MGVSLPLALSPPGLTSGSGARPRLSVLVRPRRGPGRGAVNGGGGRRSGGRAQPRTPKTLDLKPHNFREVLLLRGRGRKRNRGGKRRGASNPRRRRWRSPSASRRRGPRLLPQPPSRAARRAEPGAARGLSGGGAPSPLLATSGPCCSGAPRAREAGTGAPSGFEGRGGRQAACSSCCPGVVGPGRGCCMRGRAAVSRRRRWKA